MPEITERLLTRQLPEFEAGGVRRVYSTVPPTVVYSPTEYGCSLRTALEARVPAGAARRFSDYWSARLAPHVSRPRAVPTGEMKPQTSRSRRTRASESPGPKPPRGPPGWSPVRSRSSLGR